MPFHPSRREGVLNGGGELDRAASLQRNVDFLQFTDQVDDFPTGVGAPGGIAVMRATTEGTVFINHAVIVFPEKGARSVTPLGEFRPATRPQSLRRQESFAFGEVRRQPRFFKIATLAQPLAGTLDGSRRESIVDFSHALQ